MPDASGVEDQYVKRLTREPTLDDAMILPEVLNDWTALYVRGSVDFTVPLVSSSHSQYGLAQHDSMSMKST